MRDNSVDNDTKSTINISKYFFYNPVLYTFDPFFPFGLRHLQSSVLSASFISSSVVSSFIPLTSITFLFVRVDTVAYRSFSAITFLKIATLFGPFRMVSYTFPGFVFLISPVSTLISPTTYCLAFWGTHFHVTAVSLARLIGTFDLYTPTSMYMSRWRIFYHSFNHLVDIFFYLWNG